MATPPDLRPGLARQAIIAVKSASRRLAENLSSVPQVSTFKETGKLTPDEFVAAGDHLVYHCRTWSWAPVEDPSRRRPYLPPDKQCLQTKSVPCYRRCHQVSEVRSNEKCIHLSEDDEEGWVDTHHGMSHEETTVDLVGLTTQAPPKVLQPPIVEAQGGAGGSGNDDSDDEEPVADFDDFLKATVVQDDPAALPPVPPASTSAEGGVVRARSYDLSISYDNFYNTPRLWLFGFDENGKPLTPDQMYEDISTDHLHKTITLEPHPHLPPPDRLSVHPCRHAEVMKKIMSVVEEDGRELEVHTYLMVFLKFVQAVIPSIEYDYTKQLSLAT